MRAATLQRIGSRRCEAVASPRFRLHCRWLAAGFIAVAAATRARAESAPPAPWPDSFPALARPWHPRDKMVNQQNPPDFSWPAVTGASTYDLQVCADAGGRAVVHRAYGLPRNFHNFPHTFAPGTYFWRVRFHRAGAAGAWSALRRFRLDRDAWPFPVPPVDELLRPANHSVAHLQRLAQLHRDPVLQWAWRALGDAPVDQHADYLGGALQAYFSIDDSLRAEPPDRLPRARWYRDIDWVTMHSDLADAERVSLYFKSSPFGSFNHSHADQNSFVLNAYGEALAIDGGYYDGYGTPHDTTFTRRTLAHNAITHDGGLGQPIFDMTAKGRVTGLVTSDEIDACTGDATEAYKGRLSRAVRHVIYLWPDTFVLIDDLAAAAGKESMFEWWLQSLENLDLDPDHAGATIRQGGAALRVRFQHPERLTAKTETRFIGPPDAYKPGEPRVPVPPVPPILGDRGSANQIRAAFQTARAATTTLVATLQVTRAGVTPAKVTSRRHGNLLELNFPGGAKVLVRVSPAGEGTAGEISFEGAAAAVVGDTVLLLNGTRLNRGGQPLMEAGLPITVVLEKGGAGLSVPDDVEIRLRRSGVQRVRDDRGRDLPANRWAVSEDWVRLTCEPGYAGFRF